MTTRILTLILEPKGPTLNLREPQKINTNATSESRPLPMYTVLSLMVLVLGRLRLDMPHQ